MTNNIEVIDFDSRNDIIDYLVKPYLKGKVFHCADKYDFVSIIKDGYIDYTKRHKNSYGYNNKVVCLCDFRVIDINNPFFSNIMEYLKRGYLFILDEKEYPNIINPKTERVYNNTKEEGWLIPDFECWYKGILTLSKISIIYNINYINSYINQDIYEQVCNYLNF